MDRKRKAQLRGLNTRSWAGDKDVYELAKTLDSSLKKNTAFIKRLRTGINSTALSGFLSEVRTLSLQKYISEIISATAEGLSKLKTASEIAAAIEIVSALHQRFGPAWFTKQLGWLLGRGLSAPDKAQLKSWTQDVRDREEKERLSRYRILLKVVTELWLVGVLRSLDDVERPEELSNKVKEPTPKSAAQTRLKEISDVDPFPLEVLKELLGHDRDHTNLPLAVLFVKNFGFEALGVQRDQSKAIESLSANPSPIRESFDLSSSDEEEEEPLVSKNLQTRFKNILIRYLDDVKLHVVRDQKALSSQGRRNAEAYVKSGEVFEDRQANFEKQSKSQEKLITNCQVLCEVLGGEMPDLAEKDSVENSSTGIGLVRVGEYLKGSGDSSGIWEDEDERRFYQNLVDLKGRVPAVLLEDPVKKKKSDDPKKEEEEDKDEPSVSIVNKTVGSQVDVLLGRLPELQTKDMVDQLALEFCFVNSKASRNRLVKSISDVPKGRSDLLPLYSRLVATLGQYLPDVTTGLISYLDDEFRSLQRRKSKDFLGQVRMQNIRYLAELTKFGVVPDHVIFHCLKVCLDDLSRMNIEIVGSLLENCGRYLLRNPPTSPRMASFLETLSRKNSAQHLGQQERMLIENAMYYVDPPQRAAIQQKERTPMELFIRQLVYLDLNKKSYAKVLKSIRKLHWEEPEVVAVLEKVFSKPGKVKYSNIHLLAILISALYRYHQDFAIGIIDTVLEQIILGLEQNDFKFSQRRIAEIKYLGELYNYKLVDSAVIFDMLYRVVTFGHEGGTPTPGRTNPLDLSDDFFRIRLVCTVLDTCGVCFDRGHSKKKLDFYLTFFQFYIRTKHPLPMDIDFIVQETYSVLRPQWKLLTDIQEASQAFSEAVALNYQQDSQSKVETEAEPEDAESSSSEELEGQLPDEDEMSTGNEAEEAMEEATQLTDSDPDDAIYVTRHEEELDPEIEAEFDQAFEKMMAESLDSRKFERKALFDVPLPMRKAGRERETFTEDSIRVETPSNTMSFALMTKKGNRQQTRTIDLPSDSTFAIAMKSQKAAEREEQQRIKNLVLRYDMSQESNDPSSSIGDHTASLHSPFLSPSLNSPYGTLLPNPNHLNDAYLPNRHTGPERHSSSAAQHQHQRSSGGGGGGTGGGTGSGGASGGGGGGRPAPRARKLQLSDVDSGWYGTPKPAAVPPGRTRGSSRGRGRGRPSSFR